MAGKISIYTLGHSGVILDWNTLEPNLAEDSLRASQNASVEMVNAHGGALRKRPGLRKFNIANAGGVILGGTPMAVAGTGGAPTSGGGSSTGSGVGTGDGTGAPGGTSGSSISSGGTGGGGVIVPSAGANVFNGGSPIFGGKRLIVLGLTNNTFVTAGGQGWYVTSKGLADVATKTLTPGPPDAVYLYPPTAIFDKANGSRPYAIDYETGQLYYAKAHNQLHGIFLADSFVLPPLQPTAVLGSGAGNVTNGSHVIAVSFLTEASGETTVSPVSSQVIVIDHTVNGKIAVTVPLGALSANITGRNVYASKADTLQPLYLVGTINDNSTTSFSLNIADAGFSGTTAPGSNTALDVVDASIRIQRTSGASQDLVCVLPHTPGLPALPPLEVTPWGVDFDPGVAPAGRPTRAAVTAMCLDRTTGFEDKVLYIAEKCRAYGQNNAHESGNWGRIVRYNITTGALDVLNTGNAPISDTNRTTINGIPYCLAYFQRSLFWGNFNLNAASELVKDTAAGIAIYATTQDKSYSVTDFAGGSQGEGVTCMLAFPRYVPAALAGTGFDPRANEILFAGLAVHKATPTLSYILARQRGPVGASLGAWAATQQGGGIEAASDGNYFVSMVEFKDCLYASYYNPGTSAHIYKFTPSYGVGHLAADGHWNGDGIWSTVLSDSGIFHAYFLAVDQDTMYAIALGPEGIAGANRLDYVTTDGSSWTDKTSNIGTFAGDGATPLPILFGLDQT